MDEKKEQEYKLIAEIRIRYTDDSEDVVGMDENWTEEQLAELDKALAAPE